MADVDVDFEDLKENRFAHLLKPLRDLQDNFNVDLARELEEYLEQLENAQFAFEGARHVTVDFAEAALLIQGSALVFSKKVEYLYNLTYQALEAVKGRRRQVGPDGQQVDGENPVQSKAGARGRPTAFVRAADEDEEDSLERVWITEPYLKKASDIDLAPGEGLLPNAGTAMRPPAALLALEDHGQGTASGGGGKGDGDAGVYRLQQCTVHCSGALLLDPRDGDLYDHQLRLIGPQLKREVHRWEQPIQPMFLPATQIHVTGAVGQQDAHTTIPMDVDQGPAPDYGDDDAGDHGGGGDWLSDDEGPPAAMVDAEKGVDPTAAAGAAATEDIGQRPAEHADGRAERWPASVRGAGYGDEPVSAGDGHQLDADAPKEVFDPYKPLDPAAKSSRLHDRPLVVRRCRKTQRIAAFKAATRPGVLDAAACGLLLPEFAYSLSFLRPVDIPTEEVEKRHGVGRQANRNHLDRVTRLAPDLPAPVFDECDAAAAVAADEAAAEEPVDYAQEPMAAQPDGFDDDEDVGGFGGGGGASDLDDDIGPAVAGPNGFGGDVGRMVGAWHDPPGDADNAEPGGWASDRGIRSGPVPHMGRLSEDGMAVDGEELSYEELCRAHMESMLKAAAARQVQSDLARRVGSWRQRIDPVLKAEESRPAFDIQNYGELIIKRLSELKVKSDDAQEAKDQLPQSVVADVSGDAPARQRISFSQVAADLEKFEVSRLFSAMLQLINNRNVVIHKVDPSQVSSPVELPEEPLALELLSTDLYHKTMGARLALPQQAGGEIEGGEQEEQDIHNTQPSRGKAVGLRGKGVGVAKRAKRVATERPVD